MSSIWRSLVTFILIALLVGAIAIVFTGRIIFPIF